MPAAPNVVLGNGAVVSASGGAGIEAMSENLVKVTNSTVENNAGDGVWCEGAVCHIGDGAGLGNTISGQATAGTFGIHCTSGETAYCASGENTFSGNASDIDPARAATGAP